MPSGQQVDTLECAWILIIYRLLLMTFLLNLGYYISHFRDARGGNTYRLSRHPFSTLYIQETCLCPVQSSPFS